MQIAVDVVTDLAKNFANYLYNKIKSIIIDKKAHDELYFQTAYEKYLYATKERNEKVKTLLYKQVPQYLYDFYECLGVKYKKKKIDTSDINNLFSVGHKLIITGTGGIGKTTMMKHLFLNCIEKTDYIPILIELRSLNDKTIEALDINEAIFESLMTFNFELERKYYDYSLSLGKYLFIFDGYDEVKSNLAKKIAESIQKLSNQYPDNYYIVSSRPLYNNFVAWSDFVELEAQGLSKEQALSLVKKLNYEKEIKNKFYISLKETLEILKLFFNKIAIADEERFSILLSINNNYLWTILSFLRREMKDKKLLSSGKLVTKETNPFYLKLLEKGYKPIKKSELREMNVDDIIGDPDFEEVLMLEFSDIFSVFDFGMDLLEKWENTSISNKRKLSSILEGL